MASTACFAAGPIVVLNRCFFNRRGFDVAIRPLVQVVAVESHTLFPDREFLDVGPDRLVELIPAHAQVAVGVFRADEARRRLLYASGAGIAHGYLQAAHSGTHPPSPAG